MRIGDEIKIKGAFGFLYNPTMIVLDIKGGLVKLIDSKAQTGGILSGLDSSWYGIDLIEEKIIN